MKIKDYKNFTVTIDSRGVVKASLDLPGRPLNVLNESVMSELEDIVCSLENSSKAKLLVLESGKESGFLAGADVSVIAGIETSDEGLRLIEQGQLLFQRIQWLEIPKLAVIHGPCLGGGLELSLACDYRIARDNSSTALGLPEIKLGLIPGWGGTQRLPKLIGLREGLKLILQGKTVDARKARKLGLVDRAIAPEDWEEEVDGLIEHLVHGGRLRSPKSRRPLLDYLLDDTSLGRAIAFRITEKSIAKKAIHYPALKAAVRSVRSGYQKGTDGFASERHEFIQLLSTPTCRNLLNLFFARESARNLKTWAENEIQAAHQSPIRCVGVIGAGTMGAGIAQLAATRGFEVIVKEIDSSTAKAGRKRITDLIDKLVARKGWTSGRRDELLSKVKITTEMQPLADADLIVEAVVERMDVKQKLFAELEDNSFSDTVLATNTSSLSVDEMCESLQRKESFAGLHFFNPVHRMELVEVVRGKHTREATIARLVAFVRALGKTPVVTADSPGFLVNRVLFPYLGEAVMMVREGYDVAKIDKEIRRFGMPMGPLELLDQVGIDVAFHVSHSLSDVLRDTEPVAEWLSSMVQRGYLGKKSGQGFYRYKNHKKVEAIANDVTVPSRKISRVMIDDQLSDIQRRLVYPMLFESVRCHQEHVVNEAWAIDLAMVLGTGFAPHLGGPLHLVDKIGAATIVQNADQMCLAFGERFQSPQELIQMSEQAATYFGDSPGMIDPKRVSM